MNQEKIKNYNQKILAVLGTMSLILVFILLLWAGWEFFRDVFRSRSYDESPEIVSNEKAGENFEKNVRTHQVSFEDLWLADTTNQIYIIPVSQSALKLEEFTSKSDRRSKGTLGLIDGYSSYSNYGYDQHSFNNALIYDSRDLSVNKLFSKRISINRIDIKKIDKLTFIFFVATNNDTHKDGVLNSLDSKTIYIYSVENKTLREVQSPGTDVVDYDIVSTKNQLVIRYGLDKDKDGTYSWDEPMIMKVYSIDDNKLSDLIPSNLVDELQNTLDGKK